MSDLIMRTGGKPFVNRPAAKRKVIELEKLGLQVDIVEVEGGFAIKQFDNPEESTPSLSDGPKEERRPKRVPLGTRNVLTLGDHVKDPNYHYRFFNDQDNRIEDAKKAGYELVCTKKKVRVGDPGVGRETPVGTPITKTKGGVTQYLMRIKREWYEEDQRAKQKSITANERAMRQQPNKEGRYGEVKIG
jgi:hypothetical protein